MTARLGIRFPLQCVPGISSLSVVSQESDFDAFNEVYRQYFAESPPARTTVVSALTLSANIEIDFTVYVGS
jgi:enamine deaminase RidA (YjgF/YER057c/UK114 family)